MAIDLEALKKVCEAGAPSDRVQVNRRWLRAVYAELTKAETSRRTNDFVDKVFGRGLGGRF